MCAAAVAAEAAAEREATLARSLKTMVVFTARAPVTSDATSSVVRRTPRIGLRGGPGMGWKQPRRGDGASALQFFITDGLEKRASMVSRGGYTWRHLRESECLGRAP